jgi:peptidyl-prolyl cis-trans isomerase A (cyclophilin A)
MSKALSLTLAAAACVVLAACSSSRETKSGGPAQEAPAVKKTPVPEIFKVDFNTSKGLVVVEVHRAWAPIGADHFYDLVEVKFFDGGRFFRVLRNYIAQFGLNGDPEVNHRWADSALPDDPVKQHNVKGTLTYATSGPVTRTTQLFINLRDNLQLDSHGFAPIGTVVSGMDVAERLYASYGDGPPQGEGPDQRLAESRGNDYLIDHFPRLDFIRTATIER